MIKENKKLETEKEIQNQITVIDEIDFEEDAGLGFENATSDSFAQPILQLLQPLSKVCMAENKPANAAPGKIYNNLQNECYDFVDVIMCHFETQYVEWLIQNEQYTFVRAHDFKPTVAKYDKVKW